MAYETTEALVKGRLGRFAELLHEAHLQKQGMNPHVSDPTIEGLLALAREHGAVSGKLCGAGGGGFLLLFVETQAYHAVRRALEAAGGQIAPFSFESHGLQVWRSRCR
jgi:D-glycero-alpha-D-manno-heptose-7-phosphate kinase